MIDRGEIVLQFGAVAANERERFALGRIEQRAAVRIDHARRSAPRKNRSARRSCSPRVTISAISPPVSLGIRGMTDSSKSVY